MAKVQRPEGAGTIALRVKFGDDVLEVRFDESGVGDVPDDMLDAVLERVPALKQYKPKKNKPKQAPPDDEIPEEPVLEPVEADIKENE